VPPQYYYMMDTRNPEVVAKDRWYSILVRPPKS